jgi:hypothetical protein
MFRSGMAVLPESVVAAAPRNADFGAINTHLTRFVGQAQADLGIVCRRSLRSSDSNAAIQRVVEAARELWLAIRAALAGIQSHLSTEARSRIQGRLRRVVFPIDQDPLV